MTLKQVFFAHLGYINNITPEYLYTQQNWDLPHRQHKVTILTKLPSNVQDNWHDTSIH